MFCRNCGYKVDGQNFCPNCGLACNISNNASNDVTNNTSNNLNNTDNDGKQFLIASVVMALISGVSFFVYFYASIPLAIVGLIFGIMAFKRCRRAVGIVLNAIAIIIEVVIVFLIALGLNILFNFFVFLFGEIWNDVVVSDDSEEIVEKVEKSNPLIGTWDCVNYPDGVDGEYTTTMVLDNNFDFETYEYGNKENNHIYGTYEYVDLEKKNNSGEYSYYTLEIKPNEYVIDSQNQDFDEDTIIKFEFGIATIDRVKQGILLNYANYNMIYCFVR